MRTIIDQELPLVAAIENASFINPWSIDRFVRYKKAKKTSFFGVYVKDEIVGYVIYKWDKWKLDLIAFNISPIHRGKGYGRFVMEWLLAKLTGDRRRIVAYVPETNATMLSFLSYMGFLARDVKRNFFTDKDVDAYRMSYVRLPNPKKEEVSNRS